MSKSCCHHVSVSNIVSTSLIDFMNSLSLSVCLSVRLSDRLIFSGSLRRLSIDLC